MALPASARVVTFLGTRDREGQGLLSRLAGLREREDPFALMLETDGRTIRISELKDFAPRRFTALGWHVDDIVAVVTALRKKGVVFQIYDGFGQDNLGIWTSPDKSALVAWFTDPDGNILSLTQFQNV